LKRSFIIFFIFFIFSFIQLIHSHQLFFKHHIQSFFLFFFIRLHQHHQQSTTISLFLPSSRGGVHTMASGDERGLLHWHVTRVILPCISSSELDEGTLRAEVLCTFEGPSAKLFSEGRGISSVLSRCTSENTGEIFEAQVDISGASEAFEISDAPLSLLSQTKINVSVELVTPTSWEEKVTVASTRSLGGTAKGSDALRKALENGCSGFMCTIGLSEGGSVEMRFSCNEALADYCIGGTTLQFISARLSNLPQEWLPTLPDVPANEMATNSSGCNGDDANMEGFPKSVINNGEGAHTMAEVRQLKVNKVVEDPSCPALSFAYGAQLDLACCSQPSLKSAMPIMNERTQSDDEALPSSTIPFGLGKLRCTCLSGSPEGDQWSVEFSSSLPFYLNRKAIRTLRSALTAQDCGITMPMQLWRKPNRAEMGTAAQKKGAAKKDKDSDLPVPGEDSWQATYELDFGPVMKSGGITRADLNSSLVQEEGRGREDEGMIVTAVLVLSHPFLLEGPKLKPSLSLAHISPPADPVPIPAPRDPLYEFRQDIDDFVQAALNEYASAFGSSNICDGSFTAADMLTRQDELRLALEDSGVYHHFTESLKYRIERLARGGIGINVPNCASDGVSSFAPLCDMYAFLLAEAQTVLTQRLRNIEAESQGELYIPKLRFNSRATRMNRLGSVAMDAEARGLWDKAIQTNEERIAAAARDSDGCHSTADQEKLWKDIALTYLGSTVGDREDNLLSAGVCLLRAAGLSRETMDIASHFGHLELYAAIHMELGHMEKAQNALESARDFALTQHPPKEIDEGYDTDEVASACSPSLCVLLSLAHAAQGHVQASWRAMKEAAATGGTLSHVVGLDWPVPMWQAAAASIPRRVSCAAALNVCGALLDFGLWRTARTAFELAASAEKAAKEKAVSLSLPSASPTILRYSYLVLESKLSLHSGDMVRAYELSSMATELLPNEPKGWIALADVLHAQGQLEECATAASSALVCSANAGSSSRVGLTWHLRLGNLYLYLQQPSESKNAYLTSAQLWNESAGAWIGLASACMQLHEFPEAEAALRYANCIDPLDPVIWGKMTLVLLMSTDENCDRAEEAQHTAERALSLGLKDGPMIEEIIKRLALIGRTVLPPMADTAPGCSERAQSLEGDCPTAASLLEASYETPPLEGTDLQHPCISLGA
jgi:tetratricopeptide (TPR) repeat protein